MSSRKRRPSAERFAGSQHLFDLLDAASALRREAETARDGHRQITLLSEDALTVVLFAFDADGRLSDHAVDGLVTLQTLTGSIDVTTPSRTHRVPSGSLLVLEPGIVHDVHAPVPSDVLLTVNLRHDR